MCVSVQREKGRQGWREKERERKREKEGKYENENTWIQKNNLSRYEYGK